MGKKKNVEAEKKVKVGLENGILTSVALWLCAVAFLAVALWLLPGVNYYFLKKVDSFSLFLPTTYFFTDCLRQPAGILVWLGAFFTQFFYSPWLGGLIYSLMLLGLSLLAAKAFSLPRSWWPLAYVPSISLMFATLSLGYVVYTLKSPGFAYVNLLGLAVGASIYWCYSRLTSLWLRLVIAVLVGSIGYVLFGFYGILASTLCVVSELIARRKQWYVVVAVVCAAVVFFPWWYFRTFHSLLMESSMYAWGLPRFYDNESALKLPYYVASGFMLFLAFVAPVLRKQHKNAVAGLCISVVVFVGGLVYSTFNRYNDENFDITLRLDDALQQGQWQKATQIAREQKGEPTRAVVLMTDIALMRLGVAGDQMFAFPIGCAPYITSREATAMRDVASKLLFMHFGRINDAYRWTMEDKVEKGLNVEYLKYLAQLSILNEEYALAKKYLNVLSHTMFHKDWAKRRMEYVENPESVAMDATLSAIKPLMNYKDHLGGDAGKVESYVLTVVGSLMGGPPEIVELSMQCNLVQKDLESFMPKYMLYARTHDRIPAHYQQAAAIYAYFEGIDPSALMVDENVQKSFASFIELAQKNANVPESSQARIFAPGFGSTYWYYYFLKNGMKTM